jgi:class 3 adenylate cyclase
VTRSQEWTPERLAAACGESLDRLDWYVDVGLLHKHEDGTFAADSLHRVRILEFARRRGISDEDLALATKQQGDLLGYFQDYGADSPTDKLLGEAARAVGIPETLIDDFADVLGVSDDEPATEDDLKAIELLAEALSLGLPEEALIQLIRVFADGADRMTGAEVRIFHEHVHEQFRADGLTGRDLVAATEAIGRPALRLVEPAILYLHRRMYYKANREDFLRHLAETTNPAPHRPGEVAATVLFVDLVGFTTLTVALGDERVADVLLRFSSIVRRRADDLGGRIVKQIGDAFMLAFDRPADAMEFGSAVLQDCSADADLPDLHIGAHHGLVLYRGGDYFGNTVNLAARITSVSDAGQFLITAALKEALGPAASARCHALPPRALKGVPEPVPLFELSSS